MVGDIVCLLFFVFDIIECWTISPHTQKVIFPKLLDRIAWAMLVIIKNMQHFNTAPPRCI